MDVYDLSFTISQYHHLVVPFLSFKTSYARFCGPKTRCTSSKSLLSTSHTLLATFLPYHAPYCHKPDRIRKSASIANVLWKKQYPNASRRRTARFPISTLEQNIKDWFPNVTPLCVAERCKRHAGKENHTLLTWKRVENEGDSCPMRFEITSWRNTRTRDSSTQEVAQGWGEREKGPLGGWAVFKASLDYYECLKGHTWVPHANRKAVGCSRSPRLIGGGSERTYIPQSLQVIHIGSNSIGHWSLGLKRSIEVERGHLQLYRSWTKLDPMLKDFLTIKELARATRASRAFYQWHYCATMYVFVVIIFKLPWWICQQGYYARQGLWIDHAQTSKPATSSSTYKCWKKQKI